MSTAERLRMEGEVVGEARGEARGRLQSRTELITRQLTKRFGPLPADVMARITSADVATLDRWGDRLLDAGSLAEVFETD